MGRVCAVALVDASTEDSDAAAEGDTGLDAAILGDADDVPSDDLESATAGASAVEPVDDFGSMAADDPAAAGGTIAAGCTTATVATFIGESISTDLFLRPKFRS